MRWQRLGRVFTAEGQHPWMCSHAANPVPEPLGGDQFRVYFSCRDAQNRSHVASVVVEIGDSIRVIDVPGEPLLGPGEIGSFDDSGTTVACIAQDGPATHLYYVGWNLCVTVPFRNSIGLAIRSALGEPFVKASPAPVLDRSAADPFSLSYPWVHHEGGGWRMWYGSNLFWGPEPGQMTYGIKSATSTDGVTWTRDGRPVLRPALPEEPVLARPCVLRLDDRYAMWYCRRTRVVGGKAAPYRLGYAESADGLAWERRDDLAGLEPSGDGWDSDEVCYPAVFNHRGARYLLYNGNGYGRTGFGIARAA